MFSETFLNCSQMRFRSECEAINVVSMLYSSSLLGLVASGETPGTSPRKLKLWNSQSKVLLRRKQELLSDKLLFRKRYARFRFLRLY